MSQQQSEESQVCRPMTLDELYQALVDAKIRKNAAQKEAEKAVNHLNLCKEISASIINQIALRAEEEAKRRQAAADEINQADWSGPR